MPEPIDNLLASVSNIKFVPVKVVSSIEKPPIEPDLNTALPFASILEDANSIVFAPPPLCVAGVNIVSAATVPWMVTPLVIVPPLNNTSEPVICPLSFNINLSFEEFIWVSVISNPPIVPSPAWILPDIAIPSADADSTVTLAAVFIENESGAILMCCESVSPMVVVFPKKDAVELPVTTKNPLSFISV